MSWKRGRCAVRLILFYLCLGLFQQLPLAHAQQLPPAYAQQAAPDRGNAANPEAAPEWPTTPLFRAFQQPGYSPPAPIGTLESPRLIRLGPPDQGEPPPDFRLSTFVTVSEEFTDNALQQKNDRQSEFRTNIAPGISLNYERPATSLNFVYVPRFVIPSNSEIESNRVNQDLSLRTAWRPGTRIQFNLSEDFTQSNDSRDIQNLGTAQTGTGAFTSNRATAEAAYVAPQFRTALSYTNSLAIDSTSSVNNNMGHIGVASAEFRPPRTTLSGFYTLTRGEYQNASTASYWEQVGLGLVNYSLTPTINGTGLGSFTWHKQDEGDAFNFMLGKAQVGATVTLGPEGSMIVAEAGGQIYAPEQGNSKISPTGRIAWTQRFSYASLTASYDHGFQNNSLGISPTGLSEVSSAALLLETAAFHDVTATLGGRWNWELREQTTPAGGPSGTWITTWEARAGIRYLILRSLTLALNYVLTNRTSDQPNNEYVENYIQLSLSYNYDRW